MVDRQRVRAASECRTEVALALTQLTLAVVRLLARPGTWARFLLAGRHSVVSTNEEIAMKFNRFATFILILVGALAVLAIPTIGCGSGGGTASGACFCFQCTGSGQAVLDCQLQNPPCCNR